MKNPDVSDLKAEGVQKLTRNGPREGVSVRHLIVFKNAKYKGCDCWPIVANYKPKHLSSANVPHRSTAFDVDDLECNLPFCGRFLAVLDAKLVVFGQNVVSVSKYAFYAG